MVLWLASLSPFPEHFKPVCPETVFNPSMGSLSAFAAISANNLLQTTQFISPTGSISLNEGQISTPK